MPNLSTTPTQVSPRAAQDAVHIPFVVHVRVVPDSAQGKRLSYFRNLEKIALRVEQDLEAAGFNVATPVAFTPQFGDYGSRLSIIGFDQVSATNDGDNAAPTTDVRVIHSQGAGINPDEPTAVVAGNRGGSLDWAQDPTAVVDARVAHLVTTLLAASPQLAARDIVHVEYNGVKYGMKKQGMRSLP
jgi:hypothetical protein